VASAQAHQATASANGDNTHHQDRSAAKPIAKYFKTISTKPKMSKYITPSGKAPMKQARFRNVSYLSDCGG
jgi:hypothetical protein